MVQRVHDHLYHRAETQRTQYYSTTLPQGEYHPPYTMLLRGNPAYRDGTVSRGSTPRVGGWAQGMMRYPTGSGTLLPQVVYYP